MKNFTPFQPNSWDNSLSAITLIHKLANHVNELIKYVNELELEANEYTDEQIAQLNQSLRTYINEIRAEIYETFASINQQILNNTNQIESNRIDINELNEDLDALVSDFSNLRGEFAALRIELNHDLYEAVQTMKSYTDLQIEIVKELIEAQNPKIIDRFGYIRTIQESYNSLIDSFNKFVGCVTFNKFTNFFQNYSFVNGSTTYDYGSITFNDFVNKFAIYENQLSNFTITLTTGVELSIDARVRKTSAGAPYLCYGDMINNYYLEFIIMCMYLGNSLGSATPTFWRDLSLKMFEENYSRASIVAMYSI